MLADPASVSGLCMHVRHPHLELPALAGLHCSVFGRRQTQQHTSVGDRGLQPGLAQHPAGTERSHCATTKDTYPVGYTDTRMVRDDTTHQLSLGDAGDGDGFGFLLERGCYQYIAFQVKKNYVKRRKREREKLRGHQGQEQTGWDVHPETVSSPGPACMCVCAHHPCGHAGGGPRDGRGGGLTRRAQLMRSSSLATTYSPRLLGSALGLGTTAPAVDTAGLVLGTGHGAGEALAGCGSPQAHPGVRPQWPLRGQDKAAVTAWAWAGPACCTKERKVACLAVAPPGPSSRGLGSLSGAWQADSRYGGNPSRLGTCSHWPDTRGVLGRPLRATPSCQVPGGPGVTPGLCGDKGALGCAGSQEGGLTC